MRHPASLPFVLGLVALIAGCAAPGPSASRPVAEPSLTALAKGMTGDEVRTAWGNPTDIRHLADGPDNGRIWVYRRTVRSSQQPVAATLVEVPWFDPIDGGYKPFKEPYYNELTTTLVQTVELVMIDDHLAGWRRRLSEERSFR